MPCARQINTTTLFTFLLLAMKTTRILLLTATVLLASWPVFSQKESPAKIVVTKRTLDADGTESTETIVKKGEAAKNFDVDQYVKANRADNAQIEITVSGTDEERSIVVKGNKSHPSKTKAGASQPNLGYSGTQSSKSSKPSSASSPSALSWDNQGDCTVAVRQKEACLGVYTDAYQQGGIRGARISGFTTGSAAQGAGLGKGDVVIKVNGQAVAGSDALWDEVSKYRIGDKVSVEYAREGKVTQTEVALKACSNNSSRVEVLDETGEQLRNFLSWNWKEEDQRRLSERSIITIRKGEGDAPTPETSAPSSIPARSLQIDNFRAYPNPTMGQVTVEFSAPAVATTVTFFDLSGRQVFREELNAFTGRYNQQFDLSEYAKGTIIIRVQQGEKVFSDQLVVN
jgi:Trypsin-like serine proteases, typically periplasmic, contain C-terminal PDZ domain